MMINPAQLLSNPIAAVGLRAALGGYVIYMARKFYAECGAAHPRFLPYVRKPLVTEQ